MNEGDEEVPASPEVRIKGMFDNSLFGDGGPSAEEYDKMAGVEVTERSLSRNDHLRIKALEMAHRGTTLVVPSSTDPVSARAPEDVVADAEIYYKFLNKG